MGLGTGCNQYLPGGDPDTKQAVVIDPAWDGRFLAEEIKKGGWDLQSIWLTHAHFDHFGGLADLLEGLGQDVKEDFFVGLHPKGNTLWKVKGGAVMFGIQIKSAPKPDHSFTGRGTAFCGKLSICCPSYPRPFCGPRDLSLPGAKDSFQWRCDL